MASDEAQGHGRQPWPFFYEEFMVMVSEMRRLKERMEEAGLGLGDALAVIGMTLEEELEEGAFDPYELFKGLNEMMDRTTRGSRIERLRPDEGDRPFHVFEVHTDDGQELGYLHMIYMRKPIPCYYLVYVEVLPPFRRKGLGNRILKEFKGLMERKRAVGLLDNIIPPHDPTFDIYTKLGWRDIEEVIEGFMPEPNTHYMVYIPPSLRDSVGRRDLLRLLYNLSKKRQVIDMRENEAMVRRSIEAFRSVYSSLERMFGSELSRRAPTPLMCFMFTKFTTKLLGFRRRIARLLGYTGGESLEQIVLADEVKALPIQPYSIWGNEEAQWERGSGQMDARDLPQALLENPTSYIEGLPLYERPYLWAWKRERGLDAVEQLTVGDLLELGFDPTRLRRLQLGDATFVIERVSPRLIALVRRRGELLRLISGMKTQRTFCGAILRVNEPLGMIRHRGNVYVLRRMIPAIHLDEALEQIRFQQHMRTLNEGVHLERTILSTIREAKEWIAAQLGEFWMEDVEELAFFVPWDLESNRVRVMVDPRGVTLENIWVA